MTRSQTLPLHVALQQAVAHHKAGQLHEAEELYHAILHAQPDNPDANHNLGVLAAQAGQYSAALSYLKTALAANQADEQYVLSYAEVLLAADRPADAQEIIRSAIQHGIDSQAVQTLAQKIQALLSKAACKQIPQETEYAKLLGLFNAGCHSEAESQAHLLLEQYPDSGFIWKVLGAALKAQDKVALPALQKASALLPDDAETHNNLGLALADLGQLEDAVLSYHLALEIDPQLAAAHFNLGNTLKVLGQLDDAAAGYRRAIQIKPDFVDAHNCLGNTLKDLGQLGGAMDSYRKVLEIKPDFVDVHCILGNVLIELGQLNGARESHARAVALQPDCAEMHFNLGNALKDLEQLDGAVTSYSRALELKPELLDAYLNLGFTLRAMGQLDNALACYRRGLEINPDYAPLRYNLGIALLHNGEFESGWRYLRKRYSPDLKQRIVGMPMLPFEQWQGESLNGKSILIWREQGLGDEIQFCRYVPQLKRLGACRVTLICKPALQELLATLDGVDVLYPLEQGKGPPEAHDFWTPMLDIPFHLGTRLHNIPADIPYLVANPARMEQVAAQLAGIDEIKVGLCWKGNPNYLADAQRSFGLAALMPLFSVAGARFFSLQAGGRVDFLSTVGSCAVDLGHEIDTVGPPFRETAALIMQLDLVITCDTSIGHLAGALGKPVWVLLPFVSDWRWMERREDSPWYPNMRLFRQSVRGDWPTVIERVAERLRRVIVGTSALVWELRPPESDTLQESDKDIIEVQVSVGELLDKITILEIKSQQIADRKQLENVQRELSMLKAAVDRSVELNHRVVELMNGLRVVNRVLWDIKDAIRECEKCQDFGPSFIELARSVYHNNDQRASLKRQINELTGSRLVEEKSYTG